VRRHENHIAAVPLRNIDNADIRRGFNTSDGIAGNTNGGSGLFEMVRHASRRKAHVDRLREQRSYTLHRWHLDDDPHPGDIQASGNGDRGFPWRLRVVARLLDAGWRPPDTECLDLPEIPEELS